MKLKITVQIQYPDSPPITERHGNTRNIEDRYEQTIEIDETVVPVRVEKIIKAFNNMEGQ